MNKKYQQFVPFCLILAAVLVVFILVIVCKPKIEELLDISSEVSRASEQKIKLEEENRKEEANRQAENIKLRALKPIYKSPVAGTNESLGVFGNMFEDIIKMAQVNGLLIRSIEYNMRPSGDLLYAENADSYNACELKFFFVGTYGQMQAFLNDMNKNFQYLTSISGLTISAFPENPDYLLINENITLYSEKPTSEINKAKDR